MSDLISRAETIKYFFRPYSNEEVYTNIDIEEILLAMPSAEKTGKWRHDKDDTLISGYCSECGWQSIILETDVADMPYCPNCGARMEAPQ